MEKACIKCQTAKPVDCFHVQRNAKDGRRSTCKVCASAVTKAWYESNKERQSARMAGYYTANRQELLAYTAEWQRNNKDLKNRSIAKRRAAQINATPAWFGELDDLAMAEAYSLRAMRSEAFGFEWHVDHVLPLQGVNVCGLHIANNIAVIPAVANLQKGNRI